MTNKRGLSLIVTSLLIILLVLVAIGIIWVVVRGFVNQGTNQIGVATKCYEIDVKATALVNTSMTTYDVTLTRTGTGDSIDGVKIVFSNATSSSPIIDSPGDIAALDTVTKVGLAGIVNVNKVEVTPYIKDDTGKENYCQSSETSF